MAYRADIEIAVKGASQITKLQKQIEDVSLGVNRVNKSAILQGRAVASINNFNKTVSASERAMRAAAQGTSVQKSAIDTYVRSVAAAEKAERSLQQAIKNRRRELGLSAPSRARPGAGTNRVSGAISNAVIGGAFPLLFGQGGGAATGGAIGGLIGGAFGGTGGFAGSLLGTLIGSIAEQGGKIKELASDIGFSAEQTRQLQDAFKLAGQDAEKFTAAVQNIRGLGLSLEEQANAIRLVSALTETYGGNIAKISNAFTSAFESGKVTQATINQLTSEGVLIQDALAEKYKVSRSAILQMAKDGEISVQTLADVLVDMGNKGLEAGQKPKTAFEEFQTALGNTSTAIGNVAASLLKTLAPAIDVIIVKTTQALNLLTETMNTELLRTQIQSQTGKIVGPKKLQEIEKEAMSIARMRYPSEAKGNQLAAGEGIISPQAQREFQTIREQLIRNELQRFGFESGVLRTPTNATTATIGQITAPSQLDPSRKGGGGKTDDAQREAERVAKALRDSQLTTKELELQLSYSERIFAAEQAKDTVLAARLEGEKRLSELGIETARRLEGETNTALQLAIAREQQAKADLLRLQTQQRVDQIEADKVERAADYLRDLEYQLELNNAASREAQTEIEIRKELDRLRKAGITDEQTLLSIAQARRALAQPTELRDFIRSATDDLNNLQIVAVNVSQGIGNAIANSMTQGIQGLIEGTQSAQEVFANFLKSVGDMLAQEGARMIATYIAIGIAKIFAGLASAGSSGGGTTSYGGGNVSTNAFNTGGIPGISSTGSVANAGGFTSAGGMFSNPSFGVGGPNFGGVAAPSFGLANGGPARANTPYLVGERGPELFVPGTSGGVMSNSDLRSSMGAAPGSPNGGSVLNMSFETSKINGVEYVSRDQLEAAMAMTRRQATKDGASRGMSMTLDRIQQSPQTRKRIGIG